MILITGTIVVEDEAEATRVRDALADRSRRSRQDAGCLDYAFSQSLEDPCEFRLTEKWATQEDLDAHLAIPDPEFFELLGTARIASALVTAAEADGEREMMRR